MIKYNKKVIFIGVNDIYLHWYFIMTNKHVCIYNTLIIYYDVVTLTEN